MHVTVTFRHMESSDPLRSYAEEKSERLQRFLFEPIEVHWVLSVEKIRHIADATIVANGVTVKANEATQDMYSAIDMALDKLEKQVRKHKEKVKDHKPHADTPESIRFAATEAEEATAAPRIAARRNVFAKPMSVEEAAMQMDVAGDDFMVFTNSDTSDINVIYRMTSGEYGLIEARTK